MEADVGLKTAWEVVQNFPREPKSLLQANITIDHRSQITDHDVEVAVPPPLVAGEVDRDDVTDLEPR